MDVRVWKWGNSRENRPYMLCTLLCFCLLLRYHAVASETAYNQEQKNEVPDPSKLDSLSNYFPYNSREDPDYKRASSFFPLRGKKLLDDDLLRAHKLFTSDQDGLEDKRSQFFPLRGKKVPDDLKRASYFMPMRGRKDDDWTEEDYDINDEANKRASSFMPMRGKKKYAAISDYLQTKAGTYSNDVSDVVNPSSSHSNPKADKRMNSFMLVRGKRSYKEQDKPNSNNSSINDSDHEEFLNHLANKRSVSFMPMRGRRESSEFDEVAPGDVVSIMLEKKKHSFMPMRGRREDYYDNSENFEKKASAFMPMRGRREFSSDENEENLDFETSKRAQSFMPMRGRRTQLRDVVFESSDMPEMESKLIDDKRASSFMPMRGRRALFQDTHSDYHENSELNPDKRASSFTLMRGRRSIKDVKREINSENSPNSSKRVFFMPMRGRKSIDEDFEVESWSPDQLYSLLDKKSSSFMPMRGRRYVDEDFTVAPWPADQLYSILNKKSSSFIPMRGQSYQDEDFTVAPWPADQLYSILNKKSSSFMPMRGRNYLDEDSTVAPWPADQFYSILNKKTSSSMPMRSQSYEDETFTVAPWPIEQLMPLLDKKAAFVPVRGKSTSNNYNEPDDYDSDLYNEYKRSSSFMPMRGRSLNGGDRNFYKPYPYLMAGIGSSLMSKPYSDQGVSYSSVRSAAERKKKLRINWDAVKRAFHATRGKRYQEIGAFVHSQKDNYTTEPRLSQEEIIPSGKDSDAQMRTKRSISRPSFALQPSRQYIALKRPMSFFATRGKRFDDSAVDKVSNLH